MSRAEAVRDIINQSPAFATAYLWTLMFILAFCLVKGIFDIITKRRI